MATWLYADTISVLPVPLARRSFLPFSEAPLFTLKLAAAAAVAALVSLVPASTAFAAYEDPVIEIEVAPNPLIGGNSFSGTATSGGVECAWTVTFMDQVVVGSGTSIDFEFDTPEVDEETDKPLRVTCRYEDGNTPNLASAQAGTVNVEPASYSTTTSALPTVIQSRTATVTITLLPEGDDDDGDGNDDGDGTGSGSGALPDTGGPNGTILLTGVALVAVGTGAVYIVRRRRSELA